MPRSRKSKKNTNATDNASNVTQRASGATHKRNNDTKTDSRETGQHGNSPTPPIVPIQDSPNHNVINDTIDNTDVLELCDDNPSQSGQFNAPNSRDTNPLQSNAITHHKNTTDTTLQRLHSEGAAKARRGASRPRGASADFSGMFGDGAGSHNPANATLDNYHQTNTLPQNQQIPTRNGPVHNEQYLFDSMQKMTQLITQLSTKMDTFESVPQTARTDTRTQSYLTPSNAPRHRQQQTDRTVRSNLFPNDCDTDYDVKSQYDDTQCDTRQRQYDTRQRQVTTRQARQAPQASQAPTDATRFAVPPANRAAPRLMSRPVSQETQALQQAAQPAYAPANHMVPYPRHDYRRTLTVADATTIFQHAYLVAKMQPPRDVVGADSGDALTFVSEPYENHSAVMQGKRLHKQLMVQYTCAFVPAAFRASDKLHVLTILKKLIGNTTKGTKDLTTRSLKGFRTGAARTTTTSKVRWELFNLVGSITIQTERLLAKLLATTIQQSACDKLDYQQLMTNLLLMQDCVVVQRNMNNALWGFAYAKWTEEKARAMVTVLTDYWADVNESTTGDEFGQPPIRTQQQNPFLVTMANVMYDHET